MAQEFLTLECRSISIGSYLIKIDTDPISIVQSWKGMQFRAPHCKTGIQLNVGIRLNEIASIEAYFIEANSCLCIKTTANCAEWIRGRLGMGNVTMASWNGIATSGNFYCPLTGVSNESRITLMLSRELSQSQKRMLRQIYGDILTEIINENIENISSTMQSFSITESQVKETPKKNIPIPTPEKVSQQCQLNEIAYSKYFLETPARLKKPVKQIQVKNVMSNAFIDNLLNPSLVDFQIIYEKGSAKVKFTLKNE